MSALIPETPVMPVMPHGDDGCQVSLLRFTPDGEVLTTAWFVAEAFIDVQEKLTTLLGPPAGNGVMNVMSMIPQLMQMISEPTSHFQIGGGPPPEPEPGT